jgi:hypothetical protein
VPVEVHPQSPATHNGYDEIAAKRIENELVELGQRLSESQQTISWLEGALPQGILLDLLRRIRSHVEEGQGDMSRLMCEAKKQVRGE